MPEVTPLLSDTIRPGLKKLSAFVTRVSRTIKSTLTLHDDITFLLQQVGETLDPDFAKAIGPKLQNGATMSEISQDIIETLPPLYDKRLTDLLIKFETKKDQLLFLHYLYCVQRYDPEDQFDILDYCTTILPKIAESRNESYEQYLITVMRKMFFSLYQRHPSITMPLFSGWLPPHAALAKIYFHNFCLYPDLLNQEFPNGLSKQSVFQSGESKIQAKQMQMLLKKYYVPGIEKYQHLFWKVEGLRFNWDYFENNLRQVSFLLQHKEKSQISPDMNLADIQRLFTLHIVSYPHIHEKLSQELTTLFEIQKFALRSLYELPTEEQHDIISTYGDYGLCEGLTWKSYTELIEQYNLSQYHTDLVDIILTRDKKHDSIDTYLLHKHCHLLSLLLEASYPLDNIKTPKDVEEAIYTYLDAKRDKMTRRDGVPKDKNEPGEFTTKRSFIDRKNKFHEDRRSQWTDEEYEELFGGMRFNKNAFIKQFYSKNNVGQGSIKDCFLVALMCGILPINFSEELFMYMVSKDPKQDGYLVRIGKKTIPVQKAQMTGRKGVQAPEFIKVIEIAFQEAYYNENRDKLLLQNIKDTLLLLGGKATVLGFWWGSIHRAQSIQQYQNNISALVPIACTGLMTVGLRTAFANIYTQTRKGFSERKDFEKTSNGKIYNKGLSPHEAFDILFDKQLRQESRSSGHLTIQDFQDIYSHLHKLKSGKTVLTVSSLNVSKNSKKRYDRVHSPHAYAVIAYDETTHIITLVNPRKNNHLYSIPLTDFLYVFDDTDIMEFNIENMFTGEKATS